MKIITPQHEELKDHRVRMTRQKPFSKWLRVLSLLGIIYGLLIGANYLYASVKPLIQEKTLTYFEQKDCESFVLYQNQYGSEVDKEMQEKCLLLGFNLE